jgi:hypothetical protein
VSEIGVKPLKGDGDFRSEECIDLLKQADIVVTNPPFSLFREYLSQLIQFDKKFLIIGTWNAISYKETFQFIRENKVWIGINSNRTSPASSSLTITQCMAPRLASMSTETVSAETVVLRRSNVSFRPKVDVSGTESQFDRPRFFVGFPTNEWKSVRRADNRPASLAERVT